MAKHENRCQRRLETLKKRQREGQKCKTANWGWMDGLHDS